MLSDILLTSDFATVEELRDMAAVNKPGFLHLMRSFHTKQSFTLYLMR